MQVIDFKYFSERLAARGSVNRSDRDLHAALGDRWAQLHAEKPTCEVEDIFSGSEEESDEESDFLGDLLFRLAYPTHRMRSYRSV